MTPDSTKKVIKTIVEYDAKKLLESAGIRVPEGILVKEIPSDLKITFPVVLKVSDPSILHKTDVGGVKLGLDQAKLKEEFVLMRNKFPSSSFLIEEMLPEGVEYIVGIVRDRTFGHVIMLGTGGIYTELYKDVTFRKIPITERDAKEMMGEISSSKFCTGFRGMKINCDRMIELLVSVSKMVVSGKYYIETMDLNPVIATEEDVIVADAKISLNRSLS